MHGFDFDGLLLKYRYPLLILLIGLIVIGFGVFVFKSGALSPQTKIEVLDSTTSGQNQKEITVEIAGSVTKPGVYKMSLDDRIEDLLVLSGGFSGGCGQGLDR